MTNENVPIKFNLLAVLRQKLKGVNRFVWTMVGGSMVLFFCVGFILGRMSASPGMAEASIEGKSEGVKGGDGSPFPSNVSPRVTVEHGQEGSQKMLAPGFSLLSTRGKSVSLSDFKGKVVFIDFWATWCPPCRISMPEVEKLFTNYRGNAVQLLGLNLDEDGDNARKFVEKKKIRYPVLLAGNSDIANAYGVSGIPHFALVDKEGHLVNMWSGFAPGMGAEWRAAIDSLLGK